MKDAQIQKLNEIPRSVWADAIKKCHNHILLRLWGRTASGAHCEQRLGMPAADYYMGGTIEGLYQGILTWKYDRYPLDEQLIRIIDSMISEQVRKYKVERKQGKKTLLIENDQLALSLEDEPDEEYDEVELKKMGDAIAMACEDNDKYKRLIQLKQQGLNYSDMCTEMDCSKQELYRLMENIARRAKRILKSL